MKSREEVLAYGLSFPMTYQDAPFHDPNWQIVRVKGNKKARQIHALVNEWYVEDLSENIRARL